MLRDLQLKAVYRSESDNLLEDFYIPALRTSIRYDRAVGYFSASMLSLAAQGLSSLIRAGGRMRLIVGGELSAEDADAIERGYDIRTLKEECAAILIKTIDQIAEDLTRHRLEAVSWMIANGNLDVKVALKLRGMYHEKIGIMSDERGDSVVFQGSANETPSALLPDFNFESINVFPSWRSELADHFKPYVDGFELLWGNRSQKTVVIDFPEAAKERLVRIAKTLNRVPSEQVETDLWRRLFSREDATLRFAPAAPVTVNGQLFSIRPHQVQALNAWRSQSFRGILELATGAGKTICALYATTRIYETAKRLFVVIAVPYQNLADQWMSEATNFSMRPVACYGGVQTWKEDLEQQLYLFNTGALPFACAIVVNKTLQSEEFHTCLERIDGDMLFFIGDECHHHRTNKMHSALPSRARYRLGLSATPDSYIPVEGTDLLTDYYGEVCFRYNLEQALADGILTPYKYFVELVDLTTEEAEEYESISMELARLNVFAGAEGEGQSDDPRVRMLLFKRSRLVGAAVNKLTLLSELLNKRSPEGLTLFYCGDGSVDEPVTGQTLRQVEAVSERLYRLGWKTALFTADETRPVRQRLLDSFKIGEIDALVAIRCLDEGIDVPACRTAYLLASSRNPRQAVQRRGRILRRSPGKEAATIYDFLVCLPEGICSKVDYERKLFAAELKRVADFAHLSLNSDYSYRKIEALLRKFDLEHHFI